MHRFLAIIETSISIAFQELRANKLRSFLSLLGVSIGIFCIVSIFTVLDSLEHNIRTSMESLGDDVLYIGKWPWMDEGGEYKWWDFLSRPSMSVSELNAIQRKSQTMQYATLINSSNGITAKHNQFEVSGVSGYGVTTNFEKMQNFEIKDGRYFNQAEIDGGKLDAVIGSEVYDELFPSSEDFSNKTISFSGRKFLVIGVLKKAGDNMAGFNFDRAVIFPFNAAASIMDVTSRDANNMLMVKAKDKIPTDELSSEVEGILRAERRIEPGEKNTFSINRLSQVTERLNTVFVMIDLVGGIIAFFSLLVGGFGIANIMFVSVKERTKIIGLKKAIGAKSSAILTEFLIEAIMLCILGGLMGIFVVLLLSFVLTHAMDFPVTLSIKNFLIGISISTFVGLLSGYIPARTAARLNPVDAIRSN